MSETDDDVRNRKIFAQLAAPFDRTEVKLRRGEGN